MLEAYIGEMVWPHLVAHLSMKSARNSSKHASFWYLFLEPHLITYYCSNIVVRLRIDFKLGMSILDNNEYVLFLTCSYEYFFMRLQ